MGAAFTSGGLAGSFEIVTGGWVAGGGFAVLVLFVRFSPLGGVKKLVDSKNISAGYTHNPKD